LVISVVPTLVGISTAYTILSVKIPTKVGTTFSNKKAISKFTLEIAFFIFYKKNSRVSCRLKKINAYLSVEW
jgi:hypothetical protein